MQSIICQRKAWWDKQKYKLFNSKSQQLSNRNIMLPFFFLFRGLTEQLHKLSSERHNNMLHLLPGLSGRLYFWKHLELNGCIGYMEEMLTFLEQSTIKLRAAAFMIDPVISQHCCFYLSHFSPSLPPSISYSTLGFSQVSSPFNASPLYSLLRDDILK